MDARTRRRIELAVGIPALVALNAALAYAIVSTPKYPNLSRGVGHAHVWARIDGPLPFACPSVETMTAVHYEAAFGDPRQVDGLARDYACGRVTSGERVWIDSVTDGFARVRGAPGAEQLHGVRWLPVGMLH